MCSLLISLSTSLPDVLQFLNVSFPTTILTLIPYLKNQMLRNSVLILDPSGQLTTGLFRVTVRIMASVRVMVMNSNLLGSA